MRGLPVILGENPFNPDGLILIEASVIDFVERYAQRSIASTEAGGILLGHRKGKHLHVVCATEPSTADRRSRFRFQREIEPHQTIATQAWRQSGQKMDYLGEWHSHPESNPHPSNIDLTEWKKITSRASECLVFLIVGNANEHWLGTGRDRTVLIANRVVSG
jgi:integrative and conjugative element protein (TIGR02256 family)